MEDWEQELIRLLTPRLLKTIICNEDLLSILFASGAISLLEKQNLANRINSSEGPSGQVSMLLDILKTRTNGYEILKEALEVTNQTGAAFMLKQPRQRKRFVEKYSKKFTDSHYEMIHYQKFLSRRVFQHFLNDHWQDLAQELDVDLSKSRQLYKAVDENSDYVPKLVEEILYSWQHANGKEATLQKLCSAFRNIGSNAIADGLWEHFTNPTNKKNKPKMDKPTCLKRKGKRRPILSKNVNK